MMAPCGSIITPFIVLSVCTFDTLNSLAERTTINHYARAFRIELEFRNVGFCGEGKTGVPGEKPLGAEKKTNNKLNPHMTSSPRIEPGPHWWKAIALTTAPSLLPRIIAGIMSPWLPETLYSPMTAQAVEQAEDWDEDYRIHCCRRRPVKEEGDILLMAREQVIDWGNHQ